MLWMFFGVLVIVVIWGVSGLIFKFNDIWQLVINIGIMIIIFLMVFLIQYSQNVDIVVIQIKFDELICVNVEVNNEFFDLEELDEEWLEEICCEYECMVCEVGDVLECVCVFGYLMWWDDEVV